MKRAKDLIRRYGPAWANALALVASLMLAGGLA
jgi:hypothetical protein